MPKICKIEDCNYNSYALGFCKGCQRHRTDAAYIRSQEKKKKSVERLRKAKTGVKKKLKRSKLKTIPQLKREARKWFQMWIRYTKVGEGCNCHYGCGKWIPSPKGCDAGHYLKAEIYKDAIFDVDNVFPVCKGCNIMDPVIEYRKYLINLNGVEFVEQLEEKYTRNRGTYKWDRKFLQDIIDKYKEICKQWK